MCQHCYVLGGGCASFMSELADSCSLPDQNDDIYVKRNAILFTTKGSELRCSMDKVSHVWIELVGQYATLRPEGTRQRGTAL